MFGTWPTLINRIALLNFVVIFLIDWNPPFWPFQGKQPGESLRKPRWDSYTLVPFEKHFYNPHPNLANADPREVEGWVLTDKQKYPLIVKPRFLIRRYRREKEISIQRGSNVPSPITNFAEAGFPDYVIKEISRQKFTNPTPIQVEIRTLRIFTLFTFSLRL